MMTGTSPGGIASWVLVPFEAGPLTPPDQGTPTYARVVNDMTRGEIDGGGRGSGKRPA